MEIKRVWGVYFSATGTTKKVVEELAKSLGKKFNIEEKIYDFTVPEKRKDILKFEKGDLVVFGMPTIAGRVPNLMLEYLKSIEGNGALAVPVSLYGNRNYDDALIELRDILADDGFMPVAAGAFVGEHSFSKILGAGRPDAKDIEVVHEFADKIYDKIIANNISLVEVKGTPKPYRWYYQPRDRKGEKIDIRKVKPLTNDKCVKCGLCARICPMGSISLEDPSQVTGICIKCCACVKRCPQEAKYYDDKGYLYHKSELEAEYSEKRNEPELFL
ncbi:hypothetical protein IX317_000165 [Fusobacterium sp. DD29]|uniref:EFR1 family ferrodoxin n=1 Tax=unclassified Fusobacterium TaxID=2648384 RepID=UPI001B8CD367|nr:MULTISPECIES: EFR1 family ferrodoxin [unclassified Fusobacterium]MBR8748506.1 hypothetical protein [Fusobacterium sp. DD29]MBR8760773.1 hypothetical protein [Fusobacterium sp. DD25]MBR8766785.1 hypothetical protein [Fusobacterium sp. DD43]MBR8770786.1 hypothetical protein [Fusobacterium sp. DD40]MBR8775003.1 hypothetical protein [Fusobacterium sp. DD17]